MYLGGMEAEQVFIQEPWRIQGRKYKMEKYVELKKIIEEFLELRKETRGKKKNYKSQIIFR